MLVAQISDFHVHPVGQMVYGGIDTNAMTRRAIATIAALDPVPDCVLVTGDLADSGGLDEYALVVDILSRLAMPVFVIPGNHDRREAMRDGLAAAYPYLRQAEDFLHYVVEDFPVRLIGLDTVVPEKVGGAICAARAAWFADRLAEGDGRPTLVFMHHPPFVTGVSGMDATMCRTDSAFAGLVESHPEIECVVAGHHHRPITRRWAGTVGFVVPGVAHQLALDLRPGQPIRFILEPPGFALHAWSPETGLVSHVAPIGDYGPSRDF
ncbi:phosphodiesterase [Mesorhizobium silamurunense]|uniref:phosphodiesterase n=1 Tax=Mesorhizobium silamurunense TaxID=499528 RepID=UPI001783D219|nr:phosphodiesterase [Mesorhizobium silamurunense]